MANALYDLGRQKFLEGSIAYLTDTIKVALVKSNYTPSLTTHEFYADVTPGSNVVGTPQTLASKTSTSGVADAADVTFTAPSSGATVSYLLIYKDTGSNATSPLIALLDTATGLPLTTNGGDVNLVWDNGSSKILKL
jgi:hypothetical protein